MISTHVLFLSVPSEYSSLLLCTTDKTVQTVTICLTMLLMFFFLFSTVLLITLSIFGKK